MYTQGVRMAFSDTWLKANNGKERAALEERGDREGLGVRVTPKGKITFQLRYRYQGAAKRLDLGSYPLMSLKEARREAQRPPCQYDLRHRVGKPSSPRVRGRASQRNRDTRGAKRALS